MVLPPPPAWLQAGGPFDRCIVAGGFARTKIAEHWAIVAYIAMFQQLDTP